VVAAPFLPASGAMVPAVAPAPELARANSSLAVARNAGTLVGPLVGGGLVALSGASTVFLVNAASFGLSAALIGTLRGDFRASPGEASARSGPLEGIRLILREPVLRALTLGFVFVDIGNGIALPGEVPIAKLFGTGATGYGALVAAWGVGGVIGARGAKAVLDRLDEPPVMVASAALLAACLTAVAAAPWFAVVLVGFAFGGLSMSMAGVGEDLLLQRQVADHVRGRVYAAHMAVIQISLAAPLLVAGVLVDAWGPRVTFGLAAGSVLLGFAALAALLVRTQPERP
jgi:MFS family permease